ncbi:FAD-dependent oxidoreductase [Herbiconiux daphne]|uniref:FAD-dependent monooxygenase n=1 Tax=Herbiconiux daphne TaxID=2970914 RepID=A0ABT2H1V2_9MICO|nr:NAD(P)/FAD-dependent oxidoreductase [Herbiconiux daphne]MCS5733926.1 FAD-dependent monooxygenase [Herbiconiux daphne]
MTDVDVDIAIVGGGPVGLFAAAALAQRGLEVAVFERRPTEREHSRAIGIHPPALAALERIGVAERVIAAGVRIDRGILRIGGESRAELDFAEAGGRFPFVVSLPQVETERILRARLAELAPRALRAGATVERFERRAAGVTVLVRHGEGALERVAARFVVGADGAGSLVRAAARIPSERHDYPYRYVMGDFADSTGDGPTAVLHLHPDGIVESFPLPGGRRRWVTHVPDGAADGPAQGGAGAGAEAGAEADARARGGAGDTDLAGTPSAALVARLIAERIGDGAAPDAATATMTSAFGVRRRIVPRMADGRMIVIGDAAHEVSPIGGQGMNLGWLDADALADLAPGLLANPSGARALLAGFERRRLHSARTASRVAEFNMSMGSPCNAATFALRGLVVTAADRGAVRRRLARAFTMQGL